MSTKITNLQVKEYNYYAPIIQYKINSHSLVLVNSTGSDICRLYKIHIFLLSLFKGGLPSDEKIDGKKNGYLVKA